MSSATTHPMTSADAAWLHMDRPTNRMIIVSVLKLAAPLSAAKLRAIMEERLVARFPRFRERVVAAGTRGGPHWEEDPNFDLGLHLHRVALPAPGDDAALQELIGDLMATDLDHSRPLWETHLVEGYGTGCALVTRLHHCVADGTSLARVMLELTDGHAAADAPDGDGGSSEAGSSRSALDRLIAPARAVASLPLDAARAVVHPRRVLGFGREAAEDAIALAHLLGSPADPPSGLKGGHGVATRVAWTAPLKLQDVKDVAHATETTVNDVLLTALAGALAGALPSGPDGEGVPERVHAVVPFDVRPPGAEALTELGNRFGLVFAGLPLGDAEPLQRLATVHEEMAAIKRSRQPAVSFAALQVMGLAPARVEARLIDLFAAKGTAVVTDVVGPDRTIRLGGVAIRDAFVWAPCAGSVGVSVSIFSYRNTVRVGFLAHAGLSPTPARMADAFTTELTALGAAAGT